MRTEKNRTALAGASKNAETALNAMSSSDFAHVPDDEKLAWAMAAIIHCDVARLVVAYAECEFEGIARLLWLGDIASKLYEARNWYNNSGTAALRKIAERKPIETKAVNATIDGLKRTHGVHRVNKYVEYRNKLGYHYDVTAISHLETFGKNDANEFFDILTSFVRFSGDWAQLTKDIIQGHQTLGIKGQTGAEA